MKLANMLLAQGRNFFYIMHLSYGGARGERKRLWNYAKENNVIGLDYPDTVRDDWVKVRESVKRLLPNIWVRQFDMFCSQMHVGDIVVVLNGWNSLLGVAEITEPRHKFDVRLSGTEASGFFDHIRQVKWIRKREYINRLTLPQPIKGFNNTLSRVAPESQRWSILTDLDI